MKELRIICSRRSPECVGYPQGTERVGLTCSRRSLTEQAVLTAGLLGFLALIDDYDNMFINFLRPKGQPPFTVRRVRSLPVGYHERTKNYLFSPVTWVRSLPEGYRARNLTVGLPLSKHL